MRVGGCGWSWVGHGGGDGRRVSLEERGRTLVWSEVSNQGVQMYGWYEQRKGQEQGKVRRAGEGEVPS